MIPKVIHYCWFGGNKKSRLIQKCIKSWKKYCPDFEIREWNEQNFDVHGHPYVAQAYEAKKWAFVSDYARHWILYEHGGVYLDTDVELIKPIEPLLEHNVLGLEDNQQVNSGLIAACPKGDWLCREMLESYDQDVFVRPDGTLNLTTVCQREEKILEEKYGFQPKPEIQQVKDYRIYPSEYFCPFGYTVNVGVTQNTYSIHHYVASWWTEEEKRYHKIQAKKEKLRTKYGEKAVRLYCIWLGVRENGLLWALKRLAGKGRREKE